MHIEKIDNKDASIERQILIGLIIDEGVVKRLHSLVDPDLFTTDVSKRVVKWCLDYWDSYSQAMGNDIQDIFEQEMENMDEKESGQIADFLTSLSKEYQSADDINTQRIVDNGLAFLKKQSLRRMSNKVEVLAGNNDLDGAEEEILKYKKIEKTSSRVINPWTDEDAIDRAFNNSNETLFTLPGAIGRLLNDSFEREGFIAMLGPEKRGKCLPGNQKVLLEDGTWSSISDIVKNKTRKIISYDEEKDCFVPTEIKEFWENGIKPVYRITTKTGRTVSVTKNHPFLTPNGWLDLNSIGKGDYIAVPKEMPLFKGQDLSKEKTRLLAYFIAEGCLREYNTKGSCHKVIGFTSADKNIKRDFDRCINTLGCSTSWRGIDCRVINSKKNRHKHNKNFVLAFLKKYKLWNKLSYEKTIPEEVFKFSKKNLSVFLKTLFTCDGYVSNGFCEVGFGVANENLARQVQTLLTKYGIVSVLKYGKNKKAGRWSVAIRDYENIDKYYKEIGFLFGKQSKLERVFSKKTVSQKSFLDKFPFEIAQKFHNELRKELGTKSSTRSGGQSNFNRVFTKAYTVREQIAKRLPIMRQSFSEVVETKAGIRYMNSSILWDEILEVEYIGNEETYDLTVSPHHNFIAENILVHNTFTMMHLARMAALQRCNVAFFGAGDMSEDPMIARWHIGLAGKSNKEKYTKASYLPCLDCKKNQLDACNKSIRKSRCGLGGAGSPFDAPKEYRPCTVCQNVLGDWDDFEPSPWYQFFPDRKPLTKEEAKVNGKRFAKRMAGKDFKMLAYPNDSLTVSMIGHHLDVWEDTEDFIPDVVVIDYADILAGEGGFTQSRDIENKKWKQLRKLSMERHCLVITASQSDAKSYGKKHIGMDNFSEDKRKFGHVTGMFALNQLPEEKDRGIMRIGWVVRREDEFSIFNEATVIQNLSRGRPIVDSY